MNRGRTLLIILSVGLGTTWPVGSSAHPLAPALLSLEELPALDSTDPGEGFVQATRWIVAWKVPLRAPIGVRVEPMLPESCERQGAPEQLAEGTGLVTRFEIVCPGHTLAGLEVGASGLPARGAGAVVRVAPIEGPVFQQVVTAANPVVIVPERPTRSGVVWDYASLGVSHLIFGFDHVLFVLGLLLLVAGRRALLLTVTAFTLGHSATLSLAALGIARVSTAWVEVAIALTLVATALEIVPRARKRSLFGRAPWRVAFAFGLLHGLGFAGALSGIGLPKGEIPLALFAFNVGIEIGQLAVIAGALALHALVVRANVALPKSRLRWLSAYGLGALSAYWLIERVGAALQF